MRSLARTQKKKSSRTVRYRFSAALREVGRPRLKLQPVRHCSDAGQHWRRRMLSGDRFCAYVYRGCAYASSVPASHPVAGVPGGATTPLRRHSCHHRIPSYCRRHCHRHRHHRSDRQCLWPRWRASNENGTRTVAFTEGTPPTAAFLWTATCVTTNTIGMATSESHEGKLKCQEEAFTLRLLVRPAGRRLGWSILPATNHFEVVIRVGDSSRTTLGTLA